MKLKASSIILLVFAAVLALCAAFVARSLLTSRDAAAAVQQKAEVKEEKVPDVYVVSAAKDIYPGQFISASDMRWEPVKADAVPPAAIEAKTPADREAAASLLGATVRRDVASGEVITRDSLLFSGNPGFISAVLTPGMRAVSIPTSAVASNSGLVSAGDWVDVILSLKKESAEAMGDMKDGAGTGNALAAGLNKLASQTILENVRVLALNSNTESIAPAADPKDTSGDKRNAPDRARRAEYRTITLEVSPEDARRLAVAKEVGDLQIALRSVREEKRVIADAAADPVPGQALPTRAAPARQVTRLHDTTGILGNSRQDSRTVTTYQGPTVVPLNF